jgi:Spy/CpxP family protein refolding chaperone
MKKLNRLGAVLGFMAGAGIACAPLAMAQDANSFPNAEMNDGIDISLQGPPQPPPFPGRMGGAIQGQASFIGESSENMAMGHEDGMMFMHGMGKMTDDQLEKIYAVKSEFLDKCGHKMVDLHSHERALHDLLTQPDFDKSKAMSIQSKINGLRDELANLKLEEHMNMLNCLTAEQRKELRRNYVKHMDFGMMMMGPDPGMHPGMRGGMHGGMRGEHRGHGGPGWGEGERHHEHEHHDGPGPSGGEKS